MFNATDGKTSGASITLSFSVNICVYKEKPQAVETTEEKTNIVYPTFSVSKVSVQTKSGEGEIIIRNMLGKIVKNVPIQGNITEISTSDWPAGEYLIQIIEDEDVTTKKIIVR